MTTKWFYQNAEGQQSGPIDPKELGRLARTGIVKQDTLIRQSESGNWVRAGRVQGLFNQTAPLLPSSEVPPPPIQSRSRSNVGSPLLSPTSAGSNDTDTGKRLSPDEIDDRTIKAAQQPMKNKTPGLIPLMPGYFKYSTRMPIHTSFGEVNVTEDYIRVAYTPHWCMPTALGVYASLTLLVSPIAVIGGIGGFLICVFVYSLLTLFSTKKYEYPLRSASLVIDRTNKRIALNRKEQGRELVFGFAYASDHESELTQLNTRQADGEIVKGSKLKYYLIGVAIYLGGVALLLVMHGPQ